MLVDAEADNRAAIDMLLGDQAHRRARFAQMKESEPAEKLEKPRKAWKQI